MQEPPGYQSPPEQEPPLTAGERWDAMTSQQKAAVALAAVAVVLMIAILITLIVRSQNNDDDGTAVIVPTPTVTPVIIEITSTPEPTPTETPTTEPEPEPSPTPEPPPTEEPTPEPEPTATETPEPTPEPTPTQVPPTPTQVPPTVTPTPEPEPTPTEAPPPITGQVREPDPSGDVRTETGEPGGPEMRSIDLIAMELELLEDELEVFWEIETGFMDGVPPNVKVAWMVRIWIDNVETYRISVNLENNEWKARIKLMTEGNPEDEGRELNIPIEREDDEMMIEIPRAEVPLLTGPFTWAGMATWTMPDETVYGDNLPDSGENFSPDPDENGRMPFPVE